MSKNAFILPPHVPDGLNMYGILGLKIIFLTTSKIVFDCVLVIRLVDEKECDAFTQ